MAPMGRVMRMVIYGRHVRPNLDCQWPSSNSASTLTPKSDSCPWDRAANADPPGWRRLRREAEQEQSILNLRL